MAEVRNLVSNMVVKPFCDCRVLLDGGMVKLTKIKWRYTESTLRILIFLVLFTLAQSQM